MAAVQLRTPRGLIHVTMEIGKNYNIHTTDTTSILMKNRSSHQLGPLKTWTRALHNLQCTSCNATGSCRSRHVALWAIL